MLARLLVLLERLNIKADKSASAAAEVASDLAASQERADVVEGDAGAAADAAAKPAE